MFVRNCICVHVFALCAPGPWNPASILCALCSLWTRQAFKTPGRLSVSAVQPLRTCATTTHKSVYTHSSISGPTFRSWRDTKRWGHLMFSALRIHTTSLSPSLYYPFSPCLCLSAISILYVSDPRSLPPVTSWDMLSSCIRPSH